MSHKWNLLVSFFLLVTKNSDYFFSKGCRINWVHLLQVLWLLAAPLVVNLYLLTVLLHKCILSQRFQSIRQWLKCWRPSLITPSIQNLECFLLDLTVQGVSQNSIYPSLLYIQLSPQGPPAISDIPCQVVEIFYSWNTVWIFLIKFLSLCWWWTCLKSLDIYQIKNL